MDAGAVRLGSAGMPPDPGQLARYIDHTLLKPTATRADIVRVCEEARRYGFASVCVNSTWIGLVARLLEGSRVKPICVVGFPLGAMSTAAKAAETRLAIADGAQEIDMVIDIGALKGGDHDKVYDDIRAVVEAAQGRPVKVILETSLLERDEKIVGCAIAKAAGAAFVKTSTGFAGGGATVEDVRLMRAVVGPDMGVKASGGVRTADDARAMIDAGANRIGASASVAIVSGGTGSGGY
ncbi:MAG: deoxyribose-phosphate aldolase [Deltaproteobacteria bacterium]|nr:MAG: deoxyribose-phosphate aldolase [Deltaproteobacteria bacterium]